MTKPKVLILGHARHGKDTVAEILRDNHGFSFASSSFFVAGTAIRPALAALGVHYDTLDDCYADRVNRRAFWYEAISAYNGGGASRLAAAILETHDIYVGMRSAREFEASRHLFDHVLWVDASLRDIPAEPRASMDIDFDQLSMVLMLNHGTLQELHVRVKRWVASL